MSEELSADDLAKIRLTWSKAASAGDVVGQIFYSKLFSAAPASREMFPEEMSDQSRKLMQTLNWIIDHLDQPEALKSAAEALAIRHVRYGVLPEHYPAVGQALIETLQQGLGTEFGDADAELWSKVYGTLADTMVAAAYPAEALD